MVEVQRAPGKEAAATGANREAVVEPKGRTGTEANSEGSEVAGMHANRARGTVPRSATAARSRRGVEGQPGHEAKAESVQG